MRTVKLLLLLCIGIFCSAYSKPEANVIDAEKNAYLHNNYGLVYIEQGNYYAAVQEFKIAINLNPNTQATAVYYNNLGEVYLKLGFGRYAAQCFESSRTLYPLNVQYYVNLAKAYKAMGTLPNMINQFSKSKNILDKILLGFMHIEAGNKGRGLAVLDDFCLTEPDLLITSGVKYYMKEIKNGNYEYYTNP